MNRLLMTILFSSPIAFVLTCAPAHPPITNEQLMLSDPPNPCLLQEESRIASKALPPLDVLVIIDTSASTRVASGADIDGDGKTGVNAYWPRRIPGFAEDVLSTDPGDSILSVEVSSVCRWLSRIRHRAYRVGLVRFSGALDADTGAYRGDPTLDAEIVVSLTDRLEEIANALTWIQSRGASGGTNYAAALDLASRELSLESGGGSSGRGLREKVALFITDGAPTLPVEPSNAVDDGDVSAAIEAAQRASILGIRIHVYLLGLGALAEPIATRAIAELTGGEFTPLPEPAELSSRFGRVLEHSAANQK